MKECRKTYYSKAGDIRFESYQMSINAGEIFGIIGLSVQANPLWFMHKYVGTPTAGKFC